MTEISINDEDLYLAAEDLESPLEIQCWTGILSPDVYLAEASASPALPNVSPYSDFDEKSSKYTIKISGKCNPSVNVQEV
ncbi:hypothetical protein GDO78_011004 [Eleutherodactylus coqui]|uniref:Uncharacterized protein n=1 Tax=Eleutherodactylus coqui TaxID=57060 RepID=A0A8J6F6Q0_ELECQ|nr:hypothetical protein GDO78_011004 [Eleutherodactylus coqui]